MEDALVVGISALCCVRAAASRGETVEGTLDQSPASAINASATMIAGSTILCASHTRKGGHVCLWGYGTRRGV